MGRCVIKIYLCGAITEYYKQNRFEDAVAWRTAFKEKLKQLDGNFEVFDPTLNFEAALGVVSHESVVAQNKHYLDKCDIIVVNLEYLLKSPGSLYEIFYYQMHGKPVLSIGKGDDLAAAMSSPHVSISITDLFQSDDEVINYLKIFYCQQ
jgi:nucleoside 2-deoxyribosyltransferase